MKHSKYIIQLTDHERLELEALTNKGKGSVRVFKRAGVLLKSDAGLTDETIAAEVGVTARTVGRIRKRFVAGGLASALYDAPRSGQPPTLDAVAEAKLVAIACSDPPDGRARWTLELLRERLLTDTVVRRVSLQAISEHLHERGIKPWREKNVVHSDRYRGVQSPHGRGA